MSCSLINVHICKYFLLSFFHAYFVFGSSFFHNKIFFLIELIYSEEIDIQLKNRLERERSTDTTTSSNVTVIEGQVPDEVEKIVSVVNDDVVFGDSFVELDNDDNVDSPNEVVQEFTTNEIVNYENERKDSTSSNNSSNSTAKPSCLLRRDSSRASVKKKVRCSETAEIIPSTGFFINCDDLQLPNEDDEDDVFSDSAPAQVSRGNMCTPYVPRKGSLPIPEALPEWFPSPRLFLKTFLEVNFIN